MATHPRIVKAIVFDLKQNGSIDLAVQAAIQQGLEGVKVLFAPNGIGFITGLERYADTLARAAQELNEAEEAAEAMVALATQAK